MQISPDPLDCYDAAVHLSPDDGRVVVGYTDSTIRVWDALKQRVLRTFGTPASDGGRAGPAAIRALTLSGDGRLGARHSGRGGAVLWDPATGRPLRTLEPAPGSVTVLAFAPDARTLAGGLSGPLLRDPVRGAMETAAVVWDVRSGRIVHGLRGPYGPEEVNSGEPLLEPHPFALLSRPVFSPDGRLLAVTRGGEMTTIWDTRSWKDVKTIADGTGDVQTQVFSTDGALFATGSWDNHLRVYETRNWSRLWQKEAHSGRTSVLAFAPDGRTLLSVGAGGDLKFWNLERRREMFALPHSTLSLMKFSRDGGVLLLQVSGRSPVFPRAPGGHLVYVYQAPSLAEIDQTDSRVRAER